MYNVWFTRDGYDCLFMAGVASLSVARNIAYNITVESGFEAWVDECPGHYDDDATLTSGAGIGEATYCDGSCL